MAIFRFDDIASTLRGYWNPNEAGTLTTSGNTVVSLAPAYPDTAPTLGSSRANNATPIYFDGDTKIQELSAIYTDTSATTCGLDADMALGSNPYTVVMAYQKYYDTHQPAATMFQFFKADNNTQCRGADENNGTEAFWVTGSGLGAVRGPQRTTVPSVITYGFDTSNSTCNIWMNGQRADSTNGLVNDTTDVVGLSFMGRRAGANYSLLGKMAIMCVYDGILSDAEVLEVTELAQKWMLTGASPEVPGTSTSFGPITCNDVNATLNWEWRDDDLAPWGAVADTFDSYVVETGPGGPSVPELAAGETKLWINNAHAANSGNISCNAVTGYSSKRSKIEILNVVEPTP